MNILFTICGRAGSKGFKNKNLKEMNGVPLVYYTLAVIELYRSKHPDQNVVVGLNTDSQHLIESVKRQSVLEGVRFVSRKEKLAGDKVAKVDVIRDTYNALNKEGPFDVVIDLDLTSPLRRVYDIDNVLKEYKRNKAYDLVFGVVPARRTPHFNMVERRGEFYHKICDSNFTTRQEAPKSYELNASIYAYRPLFLEKEITNTILDHRCGVSVMEDYLVLDIDSEQDFQMMEFLHRYYCENNEGIKQVYEASRAFLVK